MIFSILMANYNKAPYIKAAIESVINQTYADWELLIFDDASNDNSIEIIKKYLADERIKLIKNKNNSGKIFALRAMIEKSQGDVMIVLDSDDAIDEKALEKLAAAYEKNPNCGFIYTQCYYCDENLAPKHLGYSVGAVEGKTNLHLNDVIAMATFKKEDYLKTLGYDDNMYAEDIDIVLKLEEVTRPYFINEPLYYYRIFEKSKSHGYRNELVNRSSTALAKLNAYKRRRGADIPNLNKAEIAEVLFWGIFSSLLVGRFKFAKQFSRELFGIYPYFFIDYKFYLLIFKKIIKIIKIKLNDNKHFAESNL